MSFDQLSSILNRVFFFGAFILLFLAILESVINLFGYTILREFYTAGRLLEFAAILLVFVIALLLRQLRDELREKGRAG